ncbi:class B sortase [uncultured Anaerococcus sp.]|uniref:class B sortase n=1 Tax=uncultured Anaerococcus sp. TaxID=293428 RepID=UPI00288A32DF|nr:class B sortase [uncultured Anaerococcus sp.]
MKSKIMAFIRFVLILIILACIAILGKRGLDYWTNMKNNRYIEDLSKQAEADVDSNDYANVPTEEIKDPLARLEKIHLTLLKKLKEQNSDVIAVLEIPGTGIKYPILQGPDNEFYLRKGLNKEYDIAGSIFMDVYNSPDINDDNSVIYGHHLEIDSMFTPLDQYRKQEFAEKNRTIYLTTEEGLREYLIFSAYGTPSSSDYRTLDFTYDGDKVPYFNKLRSNSEVKLDTRPFTDEDTIITLSTCQYDYEDQRLAIHAVRIK